METLSAWLLIGGSVIVALLALVMLFYEQLLVALAWLLQLVFLLGLAASTSALFLAAPYDWSAAWLVDATGVPTQLRETDIFIANVRELPTTMWARLRSPFARLLPEPDAPLEPVLPPPTVLPLPPGPLEAKLVPTLNASLAAGLRVTSFVLGVLCMLIALLYRSATDLILQLRALRSRVTELEEATAPRLRL